MDFEMTERVEKDTQETIWDFTVKDGMLATVDHSEADFQRAVIATFVQRGTVPEMETFGNQWAELLTSQVTPQQLNAQIRDSISKVVSGMRYVPSYKMEGGKLLVEIKEAV